MAKGQLGGVSYNLNTHKSFQCSFESPVLAQSELQLRSDNSGLCGSPQPGEPVSLKFIQNAVIVNVLHCSASCTTKAAASEPTRRLTWQSTSSSSGAEKARAVYVESTWQLKVFVVWRYQLPI